MTIELTRADVDLTKVDWAGLARVNDADTETAIDRDSDLATLFSDNDPARAWGIYRRRDLMTCALSIAANSSKASRQKRKVDEAAVEIGIIDVGAPRQSN
jgi:hypothetical protein